MYNAFAAVKIALAAADSSIRADINNGSEATPGAAFNGAAQAAASMVSFPGHIRLGEGKRCI